MSTVAGAFKRRPHSWVTHTIYFSGNALRQRFGEQFKFSYTPQVLHMAKLRVGRKVFYRTTLLNHNGIVTVDLKGSWSWRSLFSLAWDGDPYYHAHLFEVDIFRMNEIVLYKKNNTAYRVCRIWYEDHRLWLYDLVSLDNTVEREYLYDIPLVDLDDFTFGSIAA